jgi:hypothetical protein
MLGFIKKIFGLPTKEEVDAAKAQAEVAPYKIETPAVNNKTGDLVEPVVTESKLSSVNDQITDAVTQAAPAKKPRKPRTSKVEKPAKEKAAKAKKPAVIKAPGRSKKA